MISRPKRAKASKRSPYPARGTAAGDALMGPCAGEGCDRQLYRGDIFFTPLSGGIHCVDCWEKAPGVDAEMHRCLKPFVEVEELAKQRHAEMQAGFPAFTRQNWDDMFEHTRDAFRQRALDETVPTSPPEPEEKREQVWDGEFPS